MDIKRLWHRMWCKLFGRHYVVVGTDITDGYVYVECPYCQEKLFEYEVRPDKKKAMRK